MGPPKQTEDPRDEAAAYIKAKRIDQLFQELSNRLMYHRPAQPNVFLVEVLQSIKTARKEGTPTSFFTTEDLEAMFSLFDPTETGFITEAQYKTALKNVGVDNAQVKAGINSGGKLAKAKFIDAINEELRLNSLT